MILRICIILIFSPFFSWASFSQSLPNSDHLTEFTLRNGMKVCLFQTDYEKETIVFQLFAMGGYAVLTSTDRPSGILAANIAWESGLDDQTVDQLSFELYQKSIEFEAKIQPFDRQIEASCYTEDLATCLKIIEKMFTEPRFNKEALKRVMAKTQANIRTRSQYETSAREAFLKIHTRNWSVFQPLTLQDLDYVSLSKSEKFFKQCFGNPSEFVFVLVGDFNPSVIQPLLEKHLGAIPNKSIKSPVNPISPPFPEGITKKVLDGFYRYKDTFTRVTFPVFAQIDETSTEGLSLICHIIKNRLKKNLTESSMKNLEVSYEFPFFPKLDEVWLTVQFSTPLLQDVSGITDRMIPILQELKDQGPTQEEIRDLIASLQAEEMEIEENTYILSLLSNYYRANWNISTLYEKKNATKVEKEMIKKEINRYLELDQYSVISLYR